MAEKTFIMASNKLISNYDYVPTEISEEQQETCEGCRWRWFGIDLDIARENNLYRRVVSISAELNGYLMNPPTPSCNRKSCLIDDQSLLNIEILLDKIRERKLT